MVNRIDGKVYANVDPELQILYNGYFETSPFEFQKNRLAAADSVSAMLGLVESSLGRVIDVGAGDGFVSQRLIESKAVEKITAIDISTSGIKSINALNLPIDATLFNGYEIPFEDKSFDFAVCSHVIEHVEHERLFLREIARVASSALLVVPLEGGMRGKIYRGMGHINYYTPMTFKNLVETSGFRIINSRVFPCSLPYEIHLKGAFRGTSTGVLRRVFLRLFGTVATNFMNYIIVVHCRSDV